MRVGVGGVVEKKQEAERGRDREWKRIMEVVLGEAGWCLAGGWGGREVGGGGRGLIR